MNKKILIVDDDPAILSSLRRRLKRASYECVTAETAMEGLAKALVVQPDLIILDLMMPYMTGFGFLRAIKHQKRLASIPVIVFTGMWDEEVAQESVYLGAVKYLTKDCEPKELMSLVNQCIHNSKQNSSLSSP